MSASLELEKTLSLFVASILEEVHTCLPGEVQKYDYRKKKAEVKPLIKKKLIGGEAIDIVPIVEVPVIFPGSADAILHFPINRGDTVLLVFSERALDGFLSSGRDSAPTDSRKFSTNDALAIIGLDSFKNPTTVDNNTDVILKYKRTGIRIKKSGDIEIGENSLKALVTEDVFTAMNTHTHLFPASTPNAPTGPPTYVPPLSNLLHTTQKTKAT